MLTIRQARDSDCDAMCEVQRAAILRHYARSHGENAARTWAEAVDGAACRRRVETGMIIVAEELGAILAFATFDPVAGETEVVCKPDAEPRAIPAALLAVVETEARARGLQSLRLTAMLHSEALFLASGFASSGTGELPLAGGAALPCLRMEKQLGYAESRHERRRNGIKSS